MFYRMPRFEYFAPAGLEEALSLLSRFRGGARLLAGGTDLIVRMRERKDTPNCLVSLGNVAGLDYIQPSDGRLRIGAMTTHQAIAASAVVRDRYRLLAAACGKVGTPQIRNMGTIGGNLCNAGPSADSAPALLALDARVRLASAAGQREVPLGEFLAGPFQTAIAPDEVLTEVVIPPLPPRAASSYKWLTKVTAVDETLAGVAVVLVMEAQIVADIRIALCSVAPAPFRARRAEAVLRGRQISNALVEEAAAVVAQESRPRSRPEYRRKMSAVLTRRAIEDALSGA